MASCSLAQHELSLDKQHAAGIAERNARDGDGAGTNYIVPYLKVGPEVRIRNLFVAGHAGVTTMVWPDIRTELIPFLGVAGGYCFGYQWYAVEMEAGVNHGAYASMSETISYIAACMAFR